MLEDESTVELLFAGGLVLVAIVLSLLFVVEELQDVIAAIKLAIPS